MRGKITGMNDHHSDPSHVRVEIAHGKRKRSKGPNGEKGELNDYSRKSSSVTVPKEEAANFTHGQRVNVNLSPADDQDEDDMDYGDDEQQENEAPMPSGKGKKKSEVKEKPSKTGSRLRNIMGAK